MIKTTLITILSIQILILSILFFLKKKNRLANSLLGLVLFFFSLATINFSLFHYLLHEQIIKYIPYLRLELLYALGPAIYLYTLSVTNPEFKLKRIQLFIFLPALIEFIYYRTSFYRNGANAIGFDSQNPLQLIFTIQQWIGVMYSTFFMCLSVYVLAKYKKWIYDSFSYTKNISLQWIYLPIVSFVIFWFVWFMIRLTDMLLFSGKYSDIYYYPMYIILSIMALWIGFKGYVNSTSEAIGFNLMLKPQQKVPKQTISEHKQIAENLKEKMAEEKYYLSQDLSLKMLSEKTGIQKDLLSRTINQYFKVNFHEFINRYRVEEFIKRIEMDKNKEFTFLAHAYDSGFASKSSFNAVFKKHTQKTPKDYFSNLHANK
ncbi:helix-turn-helix domain-containing protein [Aquimarina litoralis]|uniref:helix-turn-helix domain-containing protein n=1 Tax=Aquimarina litoralis TaxID=584605 RepID=UPI001C5A33A1|nr:AraC family transcriptional regulator [Aquimarina litoralis]MBW1294809.1 helix-turn-helix domain-containing protein [Aquimarina litoralis]